MKGQVVGANCSFRRVITAFTVMVMVFMGAGVSAMAAEVDGPHKVVERVTTQVLAVVDERRNLLDAEPQAFYDAVGEVLSSVVAFDYIAKGVMGRYASEATPEQKQRFSEVFQLNLISTYAKGMAVYGQQEVVVVPPEGEIGAQRKVSVLQKVRAEDGEHTVAYTMGKSRENGEWMLLNVTINGINLGSTFRSQFAQAMKKKGDLDLVIDDWSAKG